MAEEIAVVIDKSYPLQQILAKKGIEIHIQKDGLLVWVCVDGIMASRIMANGFTPIDVIDRRNPLMEGKRL